MEINDYLFSISKQKGTIVFFVFIFLILAIILSLFQPLKYGSTSKVLIIQNTVNPDPYSASKSTEYLSNILSKVILSNSFFENVLNSGYPINKNYFGETIKGQMKVWSKTVNAKAINDSGIISLNIYHTDRSQTELISRAVAYTLQTKHGLYHGGGDKVSIKIIDEPIVSNYPVKPNLVLNFGLALILSLIFSCTYIYFFPEEEYNIKFPSIKRKIKTDSLEKPESSLYVSEPLVESVEENFSEPENNFIDQPVEESFAEPENNFNENLNNLNNNFDKYDDLEIREEIAKEGSMKNIFGKPYSDDF